ncbi:hypothetical protein KIW84_063735 [Lathyrus oleraceus]|uniref:SUPPRESSOR-OF-WHITE-APRICOT-like C-terminal domain-containing protein n=1 Tax=Pisum sativum TaxID=3888 RepID=A0A9D4WAN7_PEA|nr:hypothetical protein KIW84_063735 [Pisum sativum]
MAAQQFISNSALLSAFPGSMSIPSYAQPSGAHLLTLISFGTGEQLPPYPLFPPGLIPGMVRKMQIGSGVPYSPMSPLDIPTLIPPSTVPATKILQRVSKFFKEIGEGGACIPPPPNLHQIDPKTGTYANGNVDGKPGSSGSRKLGLGAAADPNEVSQYEDVYTSYRHLISDSLDAFINCRINYPPISTQSVGALRTLILDAEETCHAFALKRLFPPADVQTFSVTEPSSIAATTTLYESIPHEILQQTCNGTKTHQVSPSSIPPTRSINIE